MPETPDGLLARLRALGIETRTVRHAPVFTVAESRALRGALPGGHSKNLFLRPAKGDGPFLLAVLEESRKASVNALARAAGAGRVRLIAVCTDGAPATSRILEVVKEAFPDTPCYVRAYDRRHSLALLARGADLEMRETSESAFAFGR